MTETEETASVKRTLAENEKIFKAALKRRKERKEIERYVPALLALADTVREALLREAAEADAAESAEESSAELLLRYRLEAFSAAWRQPESAADLLRLLAAGKEGKKKKKAKKKNKKAKKDKKDKQEK
jgi:hypothetical protein